MVFIKILFCIKLCAAQLIHALFIWSSWIICLLSGTLLVFISPLPCSGPEKQFKCNSWFSRGPGKYSEDMGKKEWKLENQPVKQGWECHRQRHLGLSPTGNALLRGPVEWFRAVNGEYWATYSPGIISGSEICSWTTNSLVLLAWPAQDGATLQPMMASDGETQQARGIYVDGDDLGQDIDRVCYKYYLHFTLYIPLLRNLSPKYLSNLSQTTWPIRG